LRNRDEALLQAGAFRVKDRVLQDRAWAAAVVKRCRMLGARASAALACQHGLALLEILISTLVVGVAVAGLALAFSSGTVWVREMGTDRVGIRLAEQQIENIRACGFPAATGTFPETQIPALGAYDGCLPPGASAVCNQNVPCFNRVTTVENVDPATLAPPAPTTCPPVNGVSPAPAVVAQRITVTVTAVTGDASATALPQASTLPITAQAWFQAGAPPCPAS
jgi:Tfp pilus assembly protein PilV